MKVSQLIEMLQGCDPDMDVHFAYGAGDYWRTTVAPSVSQIGEAVVEYSQYHSTDKVVDDEDCYDDETGDYKEGVRRVIVIE